MALFDEPIMFLSKKTYEYSKGNRKKVFLYVIMFIIASIIDFFQPILIGKILNVVQEKGINDQTIMPIFFLLFAIIFLSVGFWLFHGPARVIENQNAFLVRAKYKKYLLDGTMDLDAKWHTDHHSGDSIDKIKKGTEALYDYSGQTFEVIYSLLRLIGSYIALAYFNLNSGYIVLFMFIITITLIIKFDKVLIKQYKKLNNVENEISAKIFDVISNISTVIILRIEKLLSKSIFKKIMSPYKLYMKNRKINETKWFFVSLCGSILVFSVLFVEILKIYKTGNTVLIGSLYMLYGYVSRITNVFFHFAYKYNEIVRWKTEVQNAEEISNEFKKTKKHKQIKLVNWKEIDINGLNFSYESDEEELHLEDVNLTIKKNERIALIGESGSGKTTLLRIFRELYKPSSLRLFLDNIKLKDGFSNISSNISLIPQEPEIFSTTIRENITLGVNIKDEEIKKYTDMACFSKIIEKLPKGLDSSIVEKGVNLSGGEKQRLALARGLFACEDKEIILLDEPTSSVDAKNELRIYNNIFNEFSDKTIISSIHRLGFLTLFDKIVYFKKGKIIACGSFEELNETSKEFRRLWYEYNKRKEK